MYCEEIIGMAGTMLWDITNPFVTGYFVGYDIVLSFSSSLYQDLDNSILIDNHKSQMGFRQQ